MDTNRITKYIEENKEKYLTFLCDICSFEARATDKPELDCMLDFIAEFAQKEGFATDRTPMEKCGDFLTIDMNSGSEKGGLFLAHTDTVHTKGTFGSPAVKRTNDRIVAPGVIDCKAGIAIALLVMKALKEQGYDKHIRLILTSDEEVSNMLGSQAEVDFFNEKCIGFKWAINCETSEKDEVVISRRGVLRYNIEVFGRGGHSGIHYFDCKNPIVEASHKILALENKSEENGITYSCNIIESGTAFNTIPDKCTFSIDVRVPRHKDMEKAEQTVREIVQTDFLGGTSATLTPVSIRPPMEKDDDTLRLFNSLLDICKKYDLGSLTPIESGGGSDSCYTQQAGLPSICGMGGCGGFCHTDREYLEISSFSLRAKILALFTVDDN